LLDTHIVSKLFLTIKNHFSKPHIIVLAKITAASYEDHIENHYLCFTVSYYPNQIIW